MTSCIYHVQQSVVVEENRRFRKGTFRPKKTTTTMNKQEIINRVAAGSRLYVDFKKRTLTLDGKEFTAEEAELTLEKPTDPLGETERLYAVFKHSVPSARSDHRKREHFYALSEEELADEDLMFGVSRETARAELELHVLSCIASGALTWDEENYGKWFWKSKTDPNLIILRDWVEPAKQTTEK